MGKKTKKQNKSEKKIEKKKVYKKINKKGKGKNNKIIEKTRKVKNEQEKKDDKK